MAVYICRHLGDPIPTEALSASQRRGAQPCSQIRIPADGQHRIAYLIFLGGIDQHGSVTGDLGQRGNR